jgi:hypothetical protein
MRVGAPGGIRFEGALASAADASVKGAISLNSCRVTTMAFNPNSAGRFQTECFSLSPRRTMIHVKCQPRSKIVCSPQV